jgi:hypothetical protein
MPLLKKPKAADGSNKPLFGTTLRALLWPLRVIPLKYENSLAIHWLKESLFGSIQHHGCRFAMGRLLETDEKSAFLPAVWVWLVAKLAHACARPKQNPHQSATKHLHGGRIQVFGFVDARRQ